MPSLLVFPFPSLCWGVGSSFQPTEVPLGYFYPPQISSSFPHPREGRSCWHLLDHGAAPSPSPGRVLPREFADLGVQSSLGGQEMREALVAEIIPVSSPPPCPLTVPLSHPACSPPGRSPHRFWGSLASLPHRPWGSPGSPPPSPRPHRGRLSELGWALVGRTGSIPPSL